MNKTDLQGKFEAEIPLLNAWGFYVVQTISRLVSQQLSGGECQLSSFFKVPPSHRVKDVESFTVKALYRGKSYTNPITQITDKVGARFVVLLLKDIEIVKQVVENCDVWSYSLDRNPKSESHGDPERFVYQSVHYVVKSKADVVVKVPKISSDEEQTVPKGTACEIQIRTLLQHAYSEMTHDTMYKPSVFLNQEVKRVVSRCMALIETTDNLLMDAHESIESDTKKQNAFLTEASKDSESGTYLSGSVDVFDRNIIGKLFPLLGAYDLNDFQSYLNECKKRIQDAISMHPSISKPSQIILLFLAERDYDGLRKFFASSGISGSWMNEINAFMGYSSWD